MSLWTPGGEHEVPRESNQPSREASLAGPPPSALTGDPDFDDLTPEEQAQAQAMMAEMAEVQQRLEARFPDLEAAVPPRRLARPATSAR